MLGCKTTKNPLLEKEVWDWQDAAVAADWAMARGVFGAEMWRYYPPDFVRCLAECPEILASAGVPHDLDGAGARSWARVGERAWVRAGVFTKEGMWTWARVWMRFRTEVQVGAEVRAWPIDYTRSWIP